VNKLLASCYCDGNFESEIFPVWEMETGPLFSPSDKYSTLHGTRTMDRQETRLWVWVTITAIKTHEHDSTGARLRVPTDHDEHH